MLGHIVPEGQVTGPEGSKSEVMLGPGSYRGVWIFFKNQWEGL